MASHLFRWTMVLVVSAVWLVNGSVSAAIVELNPVADAFVAAAQPNSNFGAAGALSAAAPGLAQGEFQSVMRFDASGAKSAFDAEFGAGQWSIQSVVLKLTAAPPNNPVFNGSAAGLFGVSWMLNDTWIEGTGNPNTPGVTGITFATLPGFTSVFDEALGTFAFSGGTGGQVGHSLGLTSGFIADLDAGGLASLRLFAADSTVSYLMRSRESSTLSNRPVLEISAVPEPGTAALLILIVALRPRHRMPG